MKKFIICLAAAVLIFIFCAVDVNALDTDTFDEEIRQIEESISGEASQDLESLGAAEVDDVITSGIDGKKVFAYITDLIAHNSSAPLSALVLMTAVMLFVGVAESYNYSLRYTETK